MLVIYAQTYFLIIIVYGQLVYRSKLAEQAEPYEDMISYMKT